MSHVYHLVCGQCFEVLDVGKIATPGGIPTPGCDWFLTGWLDQGDGHRIEGAELLSVIQRWLILHRGHEVRMVSEVYLDRADPEMEFYYVDTRDEVLLRPVVPEPDDFLDADLVPGEFLKR